MKRKGLLTALLALMLCLNAGCRKAVPEKTELIVFAAASMTETLTQLGGQYMQMHDDVALVFNFDSSGTLMTQILEGAPCDIFLSAGKTQMDTLGELAERTRFDILENNVVLVVPDDNPAQLSSFDDLQAALASGTVLLSVGGADVPVGQYTQKILTFMGFDTQTLEASGCITYGSNVKEVVTQVAESVTDCGIVYQTDAYCVGLTVIDAATAQMCGPVIYPAAILNSSKQQKAAADFLRFLTQPQADEVFSSVGFTPIA